MQQKIIPVLVGTLALVLTPAIALFADQDFHTERLPFFLTSEGEAAGHPELRSGHVVDIHANGPQIGALERYMINGAKPNTSYQVLLMIFANDCDGGFLPPPLPTVTLETDKHGNAHGKVVFTADDLADFSGLTFGVQWTLEDEDEVIAYETDCIFVSVD
jgi:hypothetical protein